MLTDIIITLLLIALVFHTYQLREQIEELRERQDHLFARIAINEIQRNTALARNKNKGGDTK